MKKSKPTGKGGRPSKYRPKYAEELIAHFEAYLAEPFTREMVKHTTITSKNGNVIDTEEYKLVAKPLPSLFLFARSIGCAYFTVYRWATQKLGDEPDQGMPDNRPYRYPEFSEAYKTRVQYQEAYLSTVGLGSIANPAYAIFTAKNVLGWRDTQDQRFVDNEGNAMTPGYIVLPRRLNAEEAAREYAEPQR